MVILKVAQFLYSENKVFHFQITSWYLWFKTSLTGCLVAVSEISKWISWASPAFTPILAALPEAERLVWTKQVEFCCPLSPKFRIKPCWCCGGFANILHFLWVSKKLQTSFQHSCFQKNTIFSQKNIRRKYINSCNFFTRTLTVVSVKMV